jgi:hypothetical protein
MSRASRVILSKRCFCRAVDNRSLGKVLCNCAQRECPGIRALREEEQQALSSASELLVREI